MRDVIEGKKLKKDKKKKQIAIKKMGIKLDKKK
jgi:hypothetical protein